ncbi:MAG: hypothetical protein Q9200_007380 [Gallowayella weberi]
MDSGKVPDAWDDDWVQKADTPPVEADSISKPAKLSKAERRAKQAEFNRQMWEDACVHRFNFTVSGLIRFRREAPNQNFFLNTRTEVPFKSEFKPAMQVLSRKPPTKPAASNVVAGLGQLSVADEDDDEDEEVNTKTLTAEERQLKAQKEREEKQKKYEEARERLFGSNTVSASKSSGNTTPPRIKANGGSRGSSRNKTVAEGRSSTLSGTRQLFDPNYTAKLDSAYVQKESSPIVSGRSTPTEQQPIRNPRGPDGSGRGGFGFASRGGKV